MQGVGDMKQGEGVRWNRKRGDMKQGEGVRWNRKRGDMKQLCRSKTRTVKAFPRCLLYTCCKTNKNNNIGLLLPFWILLF